MNLLRSYGRIVAYTWYNKHKLKKFLLFISLFFIFPKIALAHSGFDLNSGNTTIHVHQSPISPLVGEKVKLVFTAKQDTKVLSNFPIGLSLIDTYFGDASKDKIILKIELKTDVNGNASFEYTFDKQNYFDVDLDFADKAGAKQEIGFLIQTRESASKPNNAINFKLSDIGFFILGVGTTIFVIDIKKRKKKG